MDLRYYLNLIGRRWWLLVLPTLIAGVVAYFGSEALPDVYQGETTLLINHSQIPGITTYPDILASGLLTNTYAELLMQHPILAEVINRLNLDYTVDQFRNEIDVDVLAETQLMVLKVKDPDQTMSAIIANVLAEVFIQSNEADLGRPGTVSVIAPAVAPETRAEPQVLLNTALAVLIGFLIGAGAVFLMENLELTRAQDMKRETLDAPDPGDVEQSGLHQDSRLRT